MQLPHRVLILPTPLGGGWSSAGGGTSGVPEQKLRYICPPRRLGIPEGVAGAEVSPRPSSLSPINSRPGVSHLGDNGSRGVFLYSYICCVFMINLISFNSDAWNGDPV